MCKLNRKGFMMAEVVIVSTIILGTLVGLYSIFSKMYVVYTERSYYYNVDAVYALRNIYKMLIDTGNMPKLINEILPETSTAVELKPYIEIIKVNSDDVLTCNSIDETTCNSFEPLVKTYFIRRAFFLKYDENSFTNVEAVSGVLENQDSNLLSDYDGDIIEGYFDYLNESMDFNEDYSYMFIIELGEGEYRYYGNYRIR